VLRPHVLGAFLSPISGTYKYFAFNYQLLVWVDVYVRSLSEAGLCEFNITSFRVRR